MGSVFKALSDPTRRCVLQLLRQGPKSAGELAEQFPVSKPTMSAHFAVLREAGLVQSDKHGKAIIYQLRMSVLEEALMEFTQLLGLDLTHRADTASVDADAALRKGTP
ncbi:MAG: autorepressor SdpR family transcription factor [Vicinamibacterales bacterium]